MLIFYNFRFQCYLYRFRHRRKLYEINWLYGLIQGKQIIATLYIINSIKTLKLKSPRSVLLNPRFD